MGVLWAKRGHKSESKLTHFNSLMPGEYSSTPGMVTEVMVSPALKSVSCNTPVPAGLRNSMVTVSEVWFPVTLCLYTLASGSPLDTLITN